MAGQLRQQAVQDLGIIHYQARGMSLANDEDQLLQGAGATAHLQRSQELGQHGRACAICNRVAVQHASRTDNQFMLCTRVWQCRSQGYLHKRQQLKNSSAGAADRPLSQLVHCTAK